MKLTQWIGFNRRLNTMQTELVLRRYVRENPDESTEKLSKCRKYEDKLRDVWHSEKLLNTHNLSLGKRGERKQKQAVFKEMFLFSH